MTHYRTLYEIAADNYGLVTSAQAKEAGVSDKEMSAIAKRGRIQRVGRGVYRLTDYIPVENDIYAESVALVGEGAFLYGESVIAMHQLAATNPTRVFVATFKRVRRRLPEYIQVVVVKPPVRCVWYEGIASQSVCDAIDVCRGQLMSERLLDALHNARRQGLLIEEDYLRLTKELKDG